MLDEAAQRRLAAEAFETALEAWTARRGGPAVDLAAAYGRELEPMVVNAHATLRSRGAAHPRLPVPPPLPAPDPAPLGAAAATAAAALTTAGAGVRVTAARAALEAAERVATAAGEPPLPGALDAAKLGAGAKALEDPACAAYREVWAAYREACAAFHAQPALGLLDALLDAFGTAYAEAKSARASVAAPGRAAAPGRDGRPAASGRPEPRRSTDRGLGGDQVEGRQAVRELLLAGRRKVQEVWVLADQDDAEVLEDIVELADSVKVPVRQTGRSKFFAQARTESSQGVLARARPLPEADFDDLLKVRKGRPAPFLLAVDGVTDPGNLGALLRTAECAGVTGVALPRHRAVHVDADGHQGRLRSRRVPRPGRGRRPATAIAQARDAGIWVIGLDAAGEESIYDIALADEPVMLVLGAEGQGLSRLVRQRCDTVASLPLGGRLASLNVSVAGALGCFEVVRRRRLAP